jgi:hypothetical protein
MWIIEYIYLVVLAWKGGEIYYICDVKTQLKFLTSESCLLMSKTFFSFGSLCGIHKCKAMD